MLAENITLWGCMAEFNTTTGYVCPHDISNPALVGWSSSRIDTRWRNSIYSTIINHNSILYNEESPPVV